MMTRVVGPPLVIMAASLGVFGCGGEETTSTAPVAESEAADASSFESNDALTLPEYLSQEGARFVLPRELGEVDASGQIQDPDAFLAAAQDAGLAAEQVAAMSDGTVNFAEHEELTRLALSCMEDAGLATVTNGVRFSEGVDMVSFGFSEGSELTELEGLQLGDACQRNYLLTATSLYRMQFGWSEEEVLARQNVDFDAFARCLEEAGRSDAPPVVKDLTSEVVEALIELMEQQDHGCSP